MLPSTSGSTSPTIGAWCRRPLHEIPEVDTGGRRGHRAAAHQAVLDLAPPAHRGDRRDRCLFGSGKPAEFRDLARWRVDIGLDHPCREALVRLHDTALNTARRHSDDTPIWPPLGLDTATSRLSLGLSLTTDP